MFRCVLICCLSYVFVFFTTVFFKSPYPPPLSSFAQFFSVHVHFDNLTKKNPKSYWKNRSHQKKRNLIFAFPFGQLCSFAMICLFHDSTVLYICYVSCATWTQRSELSDSSDVKFDRNQEEVQKCKTWTKLSRNFERCFPNFFLYIFFCKSTTMILPIELYSDKVFEKKMNKRHN